MCGKMKKIKTPPAAREATPHDSADVRLTFGDSTNTDRRIYNSYFQSPLRFSRLYFIKTTHKGTTVNRGRCTRSFSANIIIQVYGVVFIKTFTYAACLGMYTSQSITEQGHLKVYDWFHRWFMITRQNLNFAS